MEHILSYLICFYYIVVIAHVPGQYPEVPVLENVYFTSYNPVEWQTDSTPCVAGGTGYNLCKMQKGRPIAFSQDLVKWAGGSMFEAGDIVRLESTDFPDDWRCSGEFVVSDSMNKRYSMRGDIFFMNPQDNISCHADVYKVK